MKCHTQVSLMVYSLADFYVQAYLATVICNGFSFTSTYGRLKHFIIFIYIIIYFWVWGYMA